MYNYNLNFFEAWDKLNEESDVITDSDIDLSELLKDNKISAENYAAVQAASEWVARHFRKSDRIWPYQLQLMCNAYITENEILKLLNNDDNFREKVDKELKTFNYKLAKSYQFNGGEKSHKMLKAGSKNKDQCDIIKEADEEVVLAEVSTIEVKATIRNPKNATNFHNAQIAFIYLVDEKELYLTILSGITNSEEKIIKLSGSYNFPCICIVSKDIEIKDYTVDREERLAKQTAVSSAEKIDNA